MYSQEVETDSSTLRTTSERFTPLAQEGEFILVAMKSLASHVQYTRLGRPGPCHRVCVLGMTTWTARSSSLVATTVFQIMSSIRASKGLVHVNQHKSLSSHVQYSRLERPGPCCHKNLPDHVQYTRPERPGPCH